jgi:phosphonate transport system substrate-binding protein
VPREQFDEMSEEFVDISAEYGNTPTDPSEADMNLLSVSEPIPRAPIMVRSDWDHPEREAIETAILEVPDEAFQWEEEALAEELGVDPDTEEGEDAINNHQIWFDDVVPADDSDYDYIRTVLDELGLEFEDITG